MNYLRLILLSFLLFALLPTVCKSQFFFGSSKIETKKKISEDMPSSKFISDSDNSIIFQLPEKETTFKILFNSENKAYVNILAPNNNQSLNKWIKGMNASFVVKSNTEWLYYLGDDIINIKLTTKDKLPIFIAFKSKISN